MNILLRSNSQWQQSWILCRKTKLQGNLFLPQSESFPIAFDCWPFLLQKRLLRDAAFRHERICHKGRVKERNLIDVGETNL